MHKYIYAKKIEGSLTVKNVWWRLNTEAGHISVRNYALWVFIQNRWSASETREVLEIFVVWNPSVKTECFLRSMIVLCVCYGLSLEQRIQTWHFHRQNKISYTQPKLKNWGKWHFNFSCSLWRKVDLTQSYKPSVKVICIFCFMYCFTNMFYLALFSSEVIRWDLMALIYRFDETIKWSRQNLKSINLSIYSY